MIDSDNVSGMAHEGWLTRSVRDCAALLDVTGGHRPGDAFGAWSPPGPLAGEVGADPGRLRIGVLTEDPAGQTAVDPECAAAARAAADVLAGLGHDVRDGYPEVLRQGSWPMEFMPCVGVVVLREIERFGRLVGRRSPRTTWSRRPGPTPRSAAPSRASSTPPESTRSASGAARSSGGGRTTGGTCC